MAEWMISHNTPRSICSPALTGHHLEHKLACLSSITTVSGVLKTPLCTPADLLGANH